MFFSVFIVHFEQLFTDRNASLNWKAIIYDSKIKKAQPEKYFENWEIDSIRWTSDSGSFKIVQLRPQKVIFRLEHHLQSKSMDWFLYD